MAVDDLIARLRQRAADPNRRVDARPNLFAAQLGSMNLSSLMGMLGQAAADLRRVVADNQAGLYLRRPTLLAFVILRGRAEGGKK